MNKKLVGLLASSIIALSIILYVWISVNQSNSIISQDINIPAGASSKKIAHTLENKGIISSAPIFTWLTRLTGEASKLKPGLYHFEGKMNMVDVSEKLTKGEILQFKITIPEGLRTDEMLTLLSNKTNTPIKFWQDALHSIVVDGEFEGLFLPETYLYNRPLKPKLLLQQMYKARQRIESKLAKELGWDDTKLSRNRVMASIIEKETALAKERIWVSAAIHNRLKKHMALQMDPTVIYGIYRTQGSFSGNIRRNDLRKDTPWNTYTNKGLPPTPICNPGAESLIAAAHPADVNYLYFVADGTGGHAFASSLNEHNTNVRKWIRIERKMNKK
ncbi:MAG: endolytic transglycosylase MltG [Ghiorsea sp.]